jgi:DNA-binding beta-propeller fold protein YncE
VSVPRIAAFAREANGAKAPVRAIEGQATRLSRTVHGLDYDPINDEIIAPVYEAGAVLVYAGDANGAAPPKRLIQGDKTMLLGPQTASVDPVHNEILVGDASSGSILVYDRLANGNVPPKRIIRGPRTGLREITGIAADTKRNLILVVNMGATHDEHGVFIFNRLDNGNVAPKAIIGGSETGISHARQIVVDSERGKIYVAVQGTNFRGVRPYLEVEPRPDTTWSDVMDENGRDRSKPSWSDDSRGFIGIWDINDHGNVPPRAVIKGDMTKLNGCGGVAINAKEGLIIGVGNNMYTTYSVPQLFTDEYWASLAKKGPKTAPVKN